jgi:hypothetical protein
MEIPIGNLGIVKKINPDEHFTACTHSACERGQTLILSALEAARGEAELSPDMKRNSDGSVEFLNEGKRRRVYPNGTLKSKRTTDWIDMGKISESA